MAGATLALVIILQVSFIIRALLRAGLTPSARLAWVTVISALPGVGIAAYFLFGEIRLERAKRERMREVRNQLLAAQASSPDQPLTLQGPAIPSFAAGHATSGFIPVAGNRLTLLPEGDAMMEDMLSWQPQLRRCRLCHQAPLRALGGYPDAAGRADCAPATGGIPA